MRRFDSGVLLRPSTAAGLTLPELLVAAGLLGLMALVALSGANRSLARQRVEVASRQLMVSLEQARSAAERAGQPCALQLGSHGWREPAAGDAVGDLPPCPLRERTLEAGVQLNHNLTGALRISSNGLVLDGGTVVIAAEGSDLKRCLVVSLPLGVVRLGRSTAALGAPIRSADCVADSSL